MSSIRCRLTEDQYLLLSSFYENLLASRSEIWHITDFSRIVFVFGHYVHEDLLPLFRPRSIWDINLFTGVREPTFRAVSQYYQIKKVSGRHLDVQCFISDYGSSMCDEIIRAFPSLSTPSKTKWLNAAEILTGFDYIYSTEDYAGTIGPVYESIQLSVSDVDLNTRDNVRISPLEADIVAQLETAMESSDDKKLYSLIKPAIGKKNAGKLIADSLDIRRRREELLARACSTCNDKHIEVNFDFLYDLMGYELSLLGDIKKKEVLDILQKKNDSTANLIQFLQQREY
jgi:hypothetical protein